MLTLSSYQSRTNGKGIDAVVKNTLDSIVVNYELD
jgi:hypothetical protein